jgi:hypothetical protein
MTSSRYTLRLEILREAFDQYKAIGAALHASATEKQLAALKAMECEAMMRELGREEIDPLERAALDLGVDSDPERNAIAKRLRR